MAYTFVLLQLSLLRIMFTCIYCAAAIYIRWQKAESTQDVA